LAQHYLIENEDRNIENYLIVQNEQSVTRLFAIDHGQAFKSLKQKDWRTPVDIPFQILNDKETFEKRFKEAMELKVGSEIYWTYGISGSFLQM
jgi:hypothetical protein